MIKIAHIPSSGLFFDGITSCITGYMEIMDKSNMEVQVIATNNASERTIEKYENCGCKVISIPYRRTNILKYVVKLYRYIKFEKIDIVHVHGSSSLMSIELVVAILAGCKVRIAHSHNTVSDYGVLDKIFRPVFYKSYTKAFACGTDAGQWMFGEKEFSIISNGRDLKKYEFTKDKRRLYRKMLGVPDDFLIVGHVGGFNRQKNHEYLIRIFDELHKRNKKTILVLVGNGNTFENIQNLVRELNLQESVIFTGVMDNVCDYLSAFDVMLLPSLYEGLPLVVIEWQIAGLPCLISDRVTKECKITELIKFKSIEENPVVWAESVEEIICEDREENKKKILNEIRQAGYDIEVEAQKLREEYIKLYNMSQRSKCERIR